LEKPLHFKPKKHHEPTQLDSQRQVIQAGDFVLYSSQWGTLSPGRIEKVTPKRVVVRGLKFHWHGGLCQPAKVTKISEQQAVMEMLRLR
jgi:hypothetical protein